MFSLLMAGNDEDWMLADGEEGHDTFALSRFLEYTDPGIEADFKPVTSTKLQTLADHPALFMSELAGERGAEYVNMRVGRVFSLKLAAGRISYGFAIDRDLGKVPVSDRTAFEEAMGLGRWELTRTHWAVKGADLDDVLAKLDLTATRARNEVSEPDIAVPDDAEPDIVESLEDYLAIVMRNHPDDRDMEVFYRGHADQSYKLEPSLFRRNDTGGYRYLRNEAYLVREILTAHPAEFTGDEYMIDKLVRMQHYGLPTRLLDVTSNPLVALYFCCSDIRYDEHGDEVDGEVIALSTKRKDIKFFNSDTVSCIANLALLDDADKNAMDLSLDRATFNATGPAKRLLHVIGAEKPYFKPEIVPEDLGSIVFVKGRVTNSRISSQAGAFLLFGHDALLPETGLSTLDIRRIVVRRKDDILKQLARMNIRSSTIYPGIDKSAAEIAKQNENFA